MRARVRALHVVQIFYGLSVFFFLSILSLSLCIYLFPLFSLSHSFPVFVFFCSFFSLLFLAGNLFSYLSLFLAISLFIGLPIYPSIYLSIHLFIYFSFFNFFALSILSSFCQFLFRERTCTNITKLPMFLIKPNTATFLLFYFYILTAAVFHFNCSMLGQPMYQSRQLQDPLALCFIIALGRFASQVQLKLPFHLSVARGL